MTSPRRNGTDRQADNASAIGKLGADVIPLMSHDRAAVADRRLAFTRRQLGDSLERQLVTPPPLHVLRRRPPSPPVHLLDVTVEHGDRTRAHGVLWDGVLNASPEDDNEGPSPVEGLLAGVAACFVRNLRWIADGRHVRFSQIRLRLAARRDDDPPAISHVTLEVDLETDASAQRVAEVVGGALRTGTITRTVARATQFELALRVNGVPTPVQAPTGRLASRAAGAGGPDATPHAARSSCGRPGHPPTMSAMPLGGLLHPLE